MSGSEYFIKMFEAESFQNALKEFESPDLAEYEFFNESMDVKIYRKFTPVRIMELYSWSGFFCSNSQGCKQNIPVQDDSSEQISMLIEGFSQLSPLTTLGNIF